MALGALQAQQAGLQTTTNNVANLNTPGYSRERPILEEGEPFREGNVVFGGGVQLKGVESLRSSLVDLQISEEAQQQGSSQAFVNSMNQVQTLFPVDTTGIGAQISAFFQSLNNLSTDPSDLTLRQSVLTSGQNMAVAFNNTANQLASQRQQLDNNVQQQVQQINQITAEIATINSKLAGVSSTGQDYGAFLDQRGDLIQQLSALVDLSQINDGTALTLTTKQGAPLVVDGSAYSLSSNIDSDGVRHIYSSQGEDITGKVSGGQLGGTLEIRDQTIPSLQTQLDSLAGGMVVALNNAHQQGFDLYGNAGGDLFEPITGAGAASAIAVAFTDPRMLAASSDGSSGSNGNLARLSAVANQSVSNGLTPSDGYGNLVFQVGMAISNGNAQISASDAMLQQLQQQRESISGVSLDEEASNLLLYQRAYQAAARAISTVDQMLETAINMGANP